MSAKNSSPLKIMTHVVAGYPTMKTSWELLLTMDKLGLDYIEAQIPFNDPIGDGHTIMEASLEALKKGVTVENCFSLVKKASRVMKTPLIAMTYANIAFRMGYDLFVKKSKESGIIALIIPDMPLDGEKDFWRSVKKYDMPFIPVVSPNASLKRLEEAKKKASLMVYCSLKVGITGENKKEFPTKFLDSLPSFFQLPIAAGFGVDSVRKIELLRSHSDIAVIGSQIIRVLKEKGMKGVEEFLKEIKKASG